MGDRLRVGKPSWYVTSHLDQLSLPSLWGVGKSSTGLYGWGKSGCVQCSLCRCRGMVIPHGKWHLVSVRFPLTAMHTITFREFRYYSSLWCLAFDWRSLDLSHPSYHRLRHFGIKVSSVTMTRQTLLVGPSRWRSNHSSSSNFICPSRKFQTNFPYFSIQSMPMINPFRLGVTKMSDDMLRFPTRRGTFASMSNDFRSARRTVTFMLYS